MLQQGALTYCWKRKSVQTCISQSSVYICMCTQMSGRILTALKLGMNIDRFYFSFYFFFFSIIWLSRILAASCGISHWGAQAPECSGSVVMACGLSCSVARGILVSQLGMETVSPALQTLTTGPPEKSEVLLCFLYVDLSGENQGCFVFKVGGPCFDQIM